MLAAAFACAVANAVETEAEDIAGFLRPPAKLEDAVDFLEIDEAWGTGDCFGEETLPDEDQDFLGITPLNPAAECLIGCLGSELPAKDEGFFGGKVLGMEDVGLSDEVTIFFDAVPDSPAFSSLFFSSF